ncbi:MAG: hypothetical protein CMM87_04030 [Rickettsiales bacterium]|nr:hypothetical protein [Rickettsiales bacterium]|tara:strand:+ start:47208 stop:48392 length:1185 start_codon:yes stop_codon:yes gene_type:complete
MRYIILFLTGFLLAEHGHGLAQSVGPGNLTYGKLMVNPKSCQDGSASRAIQALYQMLMIPDFEKNKDPAGRFRKCASIIKREAAKYSRTQQPKHKLDVFLLDLDNRLFGSSSTQSIAGELIASLAGYIADNKPKAPSVRQKYAFTIQTSKGKQIVYLPEAIALFQSLYNVDLNKGKLNLKRSALLKGIVKKWIQSLPYRSSLSKKAMQREQNYYTPARMIAKLYEKARNNTLGNQRYKHHLDDESIEEDEEEVPAEAEVDDGDDADLEEDKDFDEDFEDEFNEAPNKPAVQKSLPKRVAFNPSQPEEDWLKQGFKRLKGIKTTTDGRWVLTGEQKKQALQSYKGFVKSICLPLYKAERALCVHYVQRRIFGSKVYTQQAKGYFIQSLQPYLPVD